MQDMEELRELRRRRDAEVDRLLEERAELVRDLERAEGRDIERQREVAQVESTLEIDSHLADIGAAAMPFSPLL